MILSSKDLEKYIRIIVQAKDYENFIGENICLSIMFLEKKMNTIITQYKLKLDDMIDSLTSNGIKMIKPKELV